MALARQLSQFPIAGWLAVQGKDGASKPWITQRCGQAGGIVATALDPSPDNHRGDHFG
ncbi:hypothetical protein D3C71_2213120 [compost metagenome]